jgi:hypothetical protein
MPTARVVLCSARRAQVPLPLLLPPPPLLVARCAAPSATRQELCAAATRGECAADRAPLKTAVYCLCYRLSVIAIVTAIANGSGKQ